MTEARARRVRPAVVRLTPTVARALARRNSRGQQPAQALEEAAREGGEVVEYFGHDDDSPVIELLKSAKPRVQTFRGKPGGNIHVSDVIGKCLRKIVLMERLGQKHGTEKLSEGQGVTFAIGDALGAYVTARVTEGHGDMIWANWKCACGETSKKGLFRKVSKIECDVCGQPLVRHNEVPFPDDEWHVTGSPDIILYMDEYGAYYIVELKSMAASMWNDLARPLPDHVIQVTFYWHLLHRAGWPLVDRCSILYTNKDFMFKLPYKEFVVDPRVADRLEPYLEDLEAFRIARDGGPLPPRTYCPSIEAPGAKACPIAVSCFGCDE